VGYLTSTKLNSAMPTSYKYALVCVFGRLYYLSIAQLRWCLADRVTWAMPHPPYISIRSLNTNLKSHQVLKRNLKSHQVPEKKSESNRLCLRHTAGERSRRRRDGRPPSSTAGPSAVAPHQDASTTRRPHTQAVELSLVSVASGGRLGSRWRTTASPALATLRSGARGAGAALGEPAAALGRSRERGLGGNELLDVCEAVTPNGLPHSRGAFFPADSARPSWEARFELLSRAGLEGFFRMKWAVSSWPDPTYQTTKSEKIWGEMRKYVSARSTKHTLSSYTWYTLCLRHSVYPVSPAFCSRYWTWFWYYCTSELSSTIKHEKWSIHRPIFHTIFCNCKVTPFNCLRLILIFSLR
jgi:hypothetical protein